MAIREESEMQRSERARRMKIHRGEIKRVHQLFVYTFFGTSLRPSASRPPSDLRGFLGQK